MRCLFNSQPCICDVLYGNMSSYVMLNRIYIDRPLHHYAYDRDVFNIFISTRQVTRATHVRTRVCPRVELILKIIIILLIIFLGFIKSKPC